MKLVWLQVGTADRDSIVWHITRARYGHAHVILLLQGRTWWRRFTCWHPCAEDVAQTGMMDHTIRTLLAIQAFARVRRAVSEREPERG